MKHDEKKIEEIKDYLKNNLGSSIEEIAEERGALFGKHISPDEIPPYVINPIIDRLKQYAEHMIKQERERIVSEIAEILDLRFELEPQGCNAWREKLTEFDY